MSDEKKDVVKFYVQNRDEIREVTSSKLASTVKSMEPCMVYQRKEELTRVLKFNDRTSFEVRSR